jgi:hypothetical protein
LRLLVLPFAQFETLQFSRRGFRKFGQKLDPTRALMRTQPLHYPVLEATSQLVVCGELGVYDDVGSRFGKSDFVVARDDCSFPDGRVRG